MAFGYDLFRKPRHPMGQYSLEFPQQDSPEPGYAGKDNEDYLKQIREAYLHEGPAQSAYRQHVQNLPQQQAPTIRNRIGAAIAGISGGLQGGPGVGFETAQSYLRAPYERDLQQYALRGQGLQEAAKLEDLQSQRRIGYAKAIKDAQEEKDKEELAKQKFNLDVAKEGNLSAYRQGVLGVSSRRATTAEAAQSDLAGYHRDIISGQAAGRAQTGVYQRGLLGQGAARLGLEGQRIGIERGRAESYKQSVNRPRFSGRNPTLDALRANQASLEDTLRENPAWNKFIDPQTGRISAEAGKDPEYETFQNTMERKKRMYLGQLSDISLPNDNEGFDFEIQ